MILSETVLQTIRRELRRVPPYLKVEIDDIREVLKPELLKRDVLEGDKEVAAKRHISRVSNKLAKDKAERKASASMEKPVLQDAISSLTESISRETPGNDEQ